MLASCLHHVTHIWDTSIIAYRPAGEVQNAIHDPRFIRSMRSIRSTDCSVISQGGIPVQDSFEDHQSQLDVGDVCDLFSFTISFTICSSRRGQKEVIFAKTAQAYFSCAQDVKLYSCLHHQSSESTSAQL